MIAPELLAANPDVYYVTDQLITTFVLTHAAESAVLNDDLESY